jgi:FkbM family methyltransferase
MAVTFQSLIQADATREQIEEWCRKQTQSYTVAGATGPVAVARVLGKYMMAMPAFDVSIASHLILDGIWEPWVTMALARHVRPGMRCMDVGACYGYYALLMRDLVGSEGIVEAWEPYWWDYIEIGTILNGLVVDVVPLAMGSVNQTMVAVASERIGRTRAFNAGGVSVRPEVKGDTGSRVLAKPPIAKPWDFIKIDVEGAEADVWEALKGVREVSPNLTVCMEFTPKKHADPENFLHRIMDDGFEVGTVGHDGVPRCCTIPTALTPDTGDFRMLWLTRST